MYLTDASRQDLASALRGLRKRPAFAVAALVTLSLGIGATSAIMAELDPSKGQPHTPLEAASINKETLQNLGYAFRS